MQNSIDILDYIINWRSISDTGFIGELFHIVRNSSGGSRSTPVGHIMGFMEPGTEYASSHWKIIMTVRDEIRYNMETGTTYVFIKSAYASKLKYNLQKWVELTHDITRINPQLPNAMQETLIDAGICSSPISIQTIIGKTQYVYSNVKFDYDD